jgi:hypothetical protein
MPEIVADLSAPACYHLFPRPGIQESQRLDPDLFCVARAKVRWDRAGGRRAYRKANADVFAPA